ncbi:hypothetical protein NDU88_005698 [Pleurodeles waltl]|uniref:Uncharacterized protein n=1 Tax=Pleurodeles waltl TaxID=8319 RepID=A0AAV7X1F9_PLEWA|nr:hypothetical protein NDU88_005698 [Pleurodeles waltl]
MFQSCLHGAPVASLQLQGCHLSIFCCVLLSGCCSILMCCIVRRVAAGAPPGLRNIQDSRSGCRDATLFGLYVANPLGLRGPFMLSRAAAGALHCFMGTQDCSAWSISSHSSVSFWPSPDFGEEDQGFPAGASSRGKYVLKEDVKSVVYYLSSNLRLPADVEQPSTSGKWFHQVLLSLVPKLPVIPTNNSLLQREWRDADRVLVPLFLGCLYPSSPGDTEVSQVLTLYPLIVNLTGKPSLLSKDVTLNDQVDKKVETALKRSRDGLSLHLQSEIYEVYAMQPLVKDFQSLSAALQECRWCLPPNSF